MKELLAVAKALSDEGRVRALLALREGPLCVCQIIELLELAPSTVSKHMAVLLQAGLVEARKEGRWIYYHLAEGERAPGQQAVNALIEQYLGQDGRIRDDRRRLKRIRKMNLTDLCRHYKPAEERT